MKREALLSLLLLALGGRLVEGGGPPDDEREGEPKCLTGKETDDVIDKFNTIITTNPGSANLLAELYSEKVTTASDSLSFVFQKPVSTRSHNVRLPTE